MTDSRSLLEREARRFDPPSDAFERLHVRRARIHRRRRVVAGVTALLITGATTAAMIRAFGSASETRPGDRLLDLSSWVRLGGDAAMEGGDLRSVVTVGEGFVAVGDTSVADGVAPVWTSPDGVAWTRLAADQAPDSPNLFDVAAGGPGVVAVGVDQDGPAAWTSTDGASWHRSTVPPTSSHGDADADAMFTVEPVGDRLFATGRVGGVPYMWTSTDGRTWAPIVDESSLGGDRDAWIADVAALGDGFVAVGTHEGSGPTRTLVWTSADGSSWSLAAEDAVRVEQDAGYMSFLLPGGPGLIGVGIRGEVWTSGDGLTWDLQPAPDALAGASIAAVAAAPDGYIAVGGSRAGGGVWTSPDGLTWTMVDTGDSLASPDADGNAITLASVAAGPDGAVAVGYVDGDLESSSGIWTTVRAPEAPGASPSAADAPMSSPLSPAAAPGEVVTTIDATSLSPGDELDLDGPGAAIDGDQGGRDLSWDGSEFDHPRFSPPGPVFAQALPGAKYDHLTLADLSSLAWSRATPTSAPGLNPPSAGEVFGVWTNGGNYAKVEVLALDGSRIRLRAVTYRGVDPPCLVRDHPVNPTTDGRGDAVLRSGEVVVCGTYILDLDSGVEGGDSGDLWWEQIDGVHAKIAANEAGVGLLNLGQVNFDALTADDLRALDYGASAIDGWPDQRNELPPGDVFAVRTSEGALAKVQVLLYGYDLTLRYVTYRA